MWFNGVTGSQRGANKCKARLRTETPMTEPLKVFWQPG